MSSVAKQKQGEGLGGFLATLFRAGMYKPNQGKVVRQVTFFTIAFLGCLVAWEVKRSSLLTGLESGGYFVMIALGAILIWVAYRSVNYPVFAALPDHPEPETSLHLLLASPYDFLLILLQEPAQRIPLGIHSPEQRLKFFQHASDPAPPDSGDQKY